MFAVARRAHRPGVCGVAGLPRLISRGRLEEPEQAEGLVPVEAIAEAAVDGDAQVPRAFVGKDEIVQTKGGRGFLTPHPGAEVITRQDSEGALALPEMNEVHAHLDLYPRQRALIRRLVQDLDIGAPQDQFQPPRPPGTSRFRAQTRTRQLWCAGRHPINGPGEKATAHPGPPARGLDHTVGTTALQPLP